MAISRLFRGKFLPNLNKLPVKDLVKFFASVKLNLRNEHIVSTIFTQHKRRTNHIIQANHNTPVLAWECKTTP